MDRLMEFARASFDAAREINDGFIGAWGDLHFFVRTTVILLVLWLFIFAATQFLAYLVGPVFLLIYYHTIFRAKNFLITETLHEWLYIHRHSKGLHSPMYLRLCDKVRKNRAKLYDARYLLLIRKSHTFFTRLMAITLVGITLWVAGFGLYAEFFDPYAPATVYRPRPPAPDEVDSEVPDYEPNGDAPDYVPYEYVRESEIMTWPVGTQLHLTYESRGGTRLRSGPGIVDTSVIEILWGDAALEYLGTFEPDELVPGLYWLYVRTPGGSTGFVSHESVDMPEFEGDAP